MGSANAISTWFPHFASLKLQKSFYVPLFQKELGVKTSNFSMARVGFSLIWPLPKFCQLLRRSVKIFLTAFFVFIDMFSSQ